MDTPRFLCDRMLGRLCRKLRLLGLDAEIVAEGESGRFLLQAEREGRIAVTMARRASDRPGRPPVVVAHGGVGEQVEELFAAIGGAPPLAPFSRCMECNVPLVEASADEAAGHVPEWIASRFNEFHRCPACNRFYWKGSHYEAMERQVARLGGS